MIGIKYFKVVVVRINKKYHSLRKMTGEIFCKESLEEV